MKKDLQMKMKRLLLLVAMITGVSSWGQVNMNATGSHTQTFDALSLSGSSNAFTNNSTIANWYSQRTGTGTNYVADNGAQNGGNLYSYGLAGSTERALGSIGSGNTTSGSFAHGVQLRNTSGQAITDVKITYTLEQWRRSGINSPNAINVYYKKSSSPIAQLNPNDNSTWTLVSGLVLTSPNNTVVSGGSALDGNATGNKLTASNISIPNLSIANNEYIMLKWEDPDQTGTDHGMAIDDVTITWTIGPGTPTVATNAATLFSTTGATLNGSINATGNTVTASFQYGSTTSYGSSIGAGPVTGNTATAIAAAVTGLAVNTQYHYRAVGTYNVSTVVNGSDATFYTLANVPGTVAVDGATPTKLNVTLDAVAVNGNPAATEFAIQELGGLYVQTNGTLGSDAVWATAATWGTKTVSGLTPSTTYKFRATARNGANTVTGEGPYAEGQTLANTAAQLSATTLSDFGSICVGSTSPAIYFSLLGENLTAADVTVGPLAGYTFATTSGGTPSASLILTPVNGQILNDIYVRLTPTAAGPYNGSILIAGGGASSINVIANGAGLHTDQAVTSGAATSINTTSAVLNGNLTTLGVCPSTIEKGFVYSLTSTNSDPTFGGTGVTKTSVGSAVVGPYTLTLPTLTSGAGYSFKAYAYNGTNYTYGNLTTFTTTGTPPALTAATGATVDNNFNITFTDNAAWRTGISGITVGGSALPAAAYDNTVAGQITFKPSQSALLQVPGSKTIVITAANFTSVTFTQSIAVGVPAKLAMGIQPSAPTANGGILATQPTITVRDQYGNATTSTAAVTANTGNGTWTIGGGVNPVSSVNGTAAFTGLTATSVAGVSGATISFTSAGLVGVTSNAFNIPAPAPANDLCSNAIILTTGGEATAGTLESATLTPLPGADADDHSDVWYKFTPTCSGQHTISLSNFTGDMDFYIFDAGCPTNNTTNIGGAVSSGTPEVVTGSFIQGTTYLLRVVAFNAPLTSFTIQITSLASAPVVTTTQAQNVTMASASIDVSVYAACGSTTGARGVVYSTSSNPVIGSPVVASGTGDGLFTANITGLTDNTTYYARAFATNSIGTTYSEQVSFTTSSVSAPVAAAATPLTTSAATGFTASWSPVANALYYSLDVSTTAFGSGDSNVVYWDFTDNNLGADGGIAVNISKVISTVGASVAANGTVSGNPTGRADGWNLGSGQKYWQIDFATTGYSNITVSSKQRSSNSGPKDFKLQYKVGSGGAWTDVPNTNVTVADNLTTGVLNNIALPVACNNQSSVYLRWIMTSNTAVNGSSVVSSGASNIDDIFIKGSPANYVAGYENKNVGNVTSYAVTGLTEGATYYYRVRAVAGNSTSVYSTTITAHADMPNYWNGTQWSENVPTNLEQAIIEGSYNTATNGTFTAGKLIVNSGTFTIASGTNFTVNGQVVNNAGAANFVVENNANLLQTTEVANVNDITVIKNGSELFRNDYTIWSSPVTGQNLQAFSEGTLPNRFYTYDTTADEFTAVGVDNVGTTDFALGKGYLIRMPNEIEGTEHLTYDSGTYGFAYEGNFIGVPNNGAINVPVLGANGGYNMVGNPYPSPINVVEFFETNSDILDQEGALYFWRKRNDPNASSYATVTKLAYAKNTAAGGDTAGTAFDGAPGTFVINPGQGFFIQAQNDGNLKFTNSMRRGVNNSQFFRTADTEPELSRLWLNVTGDAEGKFSQAVIGYTDVTTMGLDYGWDGRSLASGAVAIYTMVADTQLALQARAQFEVNDVVPVGFKATAAGSYTITLDRFDGVFSEGQDIYLRDNLTQGIYNLKDAAYNFASEAGTFNDRFQVVYTTEVLGTENPVTDANAVVVYNQDNVLHINSGSADMQDVTIFDIRGRVLFSKDGINASQFIAAGLAAQQQVLLVQIKTATGTVTKKVLF